MTQVPTIAIISPCYNESESLPALLASLAPLCQMLKESGNISLDSPIVLVDDGSSDRTWEIITEAAKKSDNIHGIKLSRNVGHQNAIIAGLQFALELGVDAAITIDADLQDDVQAIPEMISLYTCGNDIVYGIRNDRSTDTTFKRTTAEIFYTTMRSANILSVKNHADFRLMSARAINALLQFDERNIFLRGIIPQIGMPSAYVEYARRNRAAGRTKYPLKKMVNFAIEGITSFSIVPIRMIAVVGVIFLVCTLIVTAYVVSAIMIGRNIPGWASMMLSLWFIGSLILIALGIIGEYVGKIYLEVKHRPRYFIDCVASPGNKDSGDDEK